MRLLSPGILEPHFGGLGTRDGAYDPEIQAWPRFLNSAPTHQVSSYCV